MGGGPTQRVEAQKARPDALHERDDGAADGGSTQPAFCARAHQAAFVSDLDDVASGTHVRLGYDKPLRVLTPAGLIGQLDDPQDAALRRCLELGYRLSGQIDTFQQGRGRLTVRGVKAEG